MKILNFGSCNIDIVYNVDHIVKPGETLSAGGVELFVGGKGLNQSVALANAGARVYHAGCVGNDGGMLKDFMASAGVDLKYLNTVDDKTGQAIIQVDKNGENAIFLYAGANHAVTEEYIDSVLSDFVKDDFLVLQNEINNIEYIVEKAFERGMKIFLNPAPLDTKVADIDLNKIHCIIANEIESSGYTKSSDPEAFAEFIKEKYPHLSAVVTLGKSGSIYMDKEAALSQSAYSADAVDTTAAGDTFVGYFIAEISRGSSPNAALKTASAASAITVSRKGAAPSIPKIEEVILFVNENERES